MERGPVNEMQTLAALTLGQRFMRDVHDMAAAQEKPLSPLLTHLSLSPSLDPIAAVPALAHLLHLPKKALDQG